MGLTRAQASKSDLPNNPEREIGKGFGNLKFPFGVSREEMKTISSKKTWCLSDFTESSTWIPSAWLPIVLG